MPAVLGSTKSEQLRPVTISGNVSIWDVNRSILYLRNSLEDPTEGMEAFLGSSLKGSEKIADFVVDIFFACAVFQENDSSARKQGRS